MTYAYGSGTLDAVREHMLSIHMGKKKNVIYNMVNNHNPINLSFIY